MNIEDVQARLAQYWQPAETAPKTHDEILVSTTNAGVRLVLWNSHYKKYGDEFGFYEITAWMPLPAMKE